MHVADWAMLVDPAGIAVGGGVIGSERSSWPSCTSACGWRRSRPMAAARFVHDAPLWGAIALAPEAAG